MPQTSRSQTVVEDDLQVPISVGIRQTKTEYLYSPQPGDDQRASSHPGVIRVSLEREHSPAPANCPCEYGRPVSTVRADVHDAVARGQEAGDDGQVGLDGIDETNSVCESKGMQRGCDILAEQPNQQSLEPGKYLQGSSIARPSEPARYLRNVHIGHVITKLDVGGAQTVVCELARHHIEAGHRVTVWSGFLGPSASRLQELGATVVSCRDLIHPPNPRRDLAAVRFLERELSSSDASVVHTHSSKGGMVGRIAARRAGLPSVYTAHGWPFRPGMPTGQRMLSFVGEWAVSRLRSEIVTVTENDLSAARRYRIGTSGHRHVIHNGTSGPPLLESNRSESGPVEMVFVGRLAQPKRVDLLLEATRLVPTTRLTVVGDGPLLAQLKQSCSDLGERVRWVGEAVPAPFLAAADLFVFCSDHEGMPMSILEAMSYGLPFLGNDLAGLHEIARYGTFSRVVKKSPEAIAEGIVELTRSRTELRKMGLLARQAWEQEFTSASMAKSYLSVYSGAIDGLHGKRGWK